MEVCNLVTSEKCGAGVALLGGERPLQERRKVSLREYRKIPGGTEELFLTRAIRRDVEGAVPYEGSWRDDGDCP